MMLTMIGRKVNINISSTKIAIDQVDLGYFFITISFSYIT